MTAMATAGSRWAIVMSRGAGFSDQVLFGFPNMYVEIPFGGEEKILISVFCLP